MAACYRPLRTCGRLGAAPRGPGAVSPSYPREIIVLSCVPKFQGGVSFFRDVTLFSMFILRDVYVSSGIALLPYLCIFVSLCVLIGRIFYVCISIISCYNFPKLRNEAEDLWVIVNAIFINLFVSVNHGCCRGIYIFGNVPKPVPGRAEPKERQGCTVVKQERKMNLLTGVFFFSCIILIHVYHYGCLLWNLLGRDGT